MENSMVPHKKLRIELPYDPATPLLGIYTKTQEYLFATRYVPLCSLQHYLYLQRPGTTQCL